MVRPDFVTLIINYHERRCPNHKHLRIKVKQFTNEMRRNKRKCPIDDIFSS